MTEYLEGFAQTNKLHAIYKYLWACTKVNQNILIKCTLFVVTSP